ncbi:MAG: hypothetical protein QXL17_02680 [Candidatus Thermoplasmatota archaeon]
MLKKQHIELLKNIHNAGWKSAVIAGGIIRDTFCKKKYKDVDIFLFDPKISNETPYVSANISETIKKMGIIPHNEEFTLKQNDATTYNYTNTTRNTATNTVTNMITDVWTIEKDFDIIQLITVKVPPIEYVTKFFDIGLCMCYFDGIKVRLTHEFLNDYNNKTLTICGQLSKYDFQKTVYRHLKTIKFKYPEFKICVAPHLEQYLSSKTINFINKLNR